MSSEAKLVMTLSSYGGNAPQRMDAVDRHAAGLRFLADLVRKSGRVFLALELESKADAVEAAA